MGEGHPLMVANLSYGFKSLGRQLGHDTWYVIGGETRRVLVGPFRARSTAFARVRGIVLVRESPGRGILAFSPPLSNSAQPCGAEFRLGHAAAAVGVLVDFGKRVVYSFYSPPDERGNGRTFSAALNLIAENAAANKTPADPATARQVSLGTVPVYTFQGPGIRVTEEIANSPAQKVGIKTGNIPIDIQEPKWMQPGYGSLS